MRRLLLLAAFALLPGCEALLSLVEKPTVTLRRVDVTDVTFAGLTANFVLNVENPNPIGLPVGRLDYQLVLDGHQLAEGHAERNLSIPAAGAAEVTLPVTVRFADAGATIESVLTKDSLPYTIHLRLGFDAPGGTFTVPIEKSGSFPLPRPPEIQLAGATVGGVDLTGASVNVNLTLKNPNSYALPASSLDYTVSLDGTQLSSGSAAPGALPAGATTPVSLSLHVDFLRAGFALASALQSPSATVEVAGTLHIADHHLPFGDRIRLGN